MHTLPVYRLRNSRFGFFPGKNRSHTPPFNAAEAADKPKIAPDPSPQPIPPASPVPSAKTAATATAVNTAGMADMRDAATGDERLLHKKEPLLRFMNMNFELDDLLIIGLLILLLMEGIEDEILLILLIFLFITGWET